MKRAAEETIARYLQHFPCVAILGVRQCGKTTLLGSLPAGWKRFDLERMADRRLVEDPDLFLRLNPDRIAIDEAQLLPTLFPALRVAIDEDRARKGRFVITGSSSPELIRGISESLAGRVAMIELSPFSWEEVTGTVGRDSFVRRLQDPRANPADLVDGLQPRGSLELAHQYWFRGGYPEPWLTSDPDFSGRWMDQYIMTYLARDIRRLFPALDEVRFRRFMEMLGGLSGSVLNYAEVARALGVSQPTARDYFEIAHGTFLWRRVPAYAKDATKRVVKHPKGYLRDSGLRHGLLRIPDLQALLSHPAGGASWEGMVIEEILRQLDGLGAGYGYSFYRTGAGAEVDLVLEGAFGMVAVEIKHAQGADARDLRRLREFVVQQKARLGVLISNDVAIRHYDDRLVGLPFVCL